MKSRILNSLQLGEGIYDFSFRSILKVICVFSYFGIVKVCLIQKGQVILVLWLDLGFKKIQVLNKKGVE